MARKEKNTDNLKRFKDLILVIAGIFSAAFGVKGFLLSSHFIDGGVTGISMLLSYIFGWPIGVLLVVLSIPFIIIGYQQIGIKFVVKTSLAIIGLSLCIAFRSEERR